MELEKSNGDVEPESKCVFLDWNVPHIASVAAQPVLHAYSR